MIKEYQLRKLQNSYEVTLNYKGVKVRVAFTGGNVYNGTMPKFRTDNLFKMKALEDSQLFKNKEVVLTHTIGEKEKPHPVSKTSNKSNIGKRMIPLKPADPEPTPEPNPEQELDVDMEQADADQTKMEFDNLGEAILYIVQNYQVEVQTEKEARDVLKAHGIKPVIKKGAAI